MDKVINNPINLSDSDKCVFVNTNNPKVKSQVNQKKNIPLVKLPFPPLIDPKDLLIIGKDDKPTRSPNAFIIYRKVFFKTIRDKGHVLPMTSISSMASQSWDKEPEEVKKYYKNLAKEAYNYRNERFPKKLKRKKREKWNVISFKSNAPTSIDSTNDNNDDNNDILNDGLSNIEDLQFPTPAEDILKNPLIDTFIQLNKINNILLQNLIMSNGLSLNVLNNNDNTQNNIQTINNLEQINNYFNNNIELQQPEQFYPSPNSSLSDESNFSSPNLSELFNSFPIESLQQMRNNGSEQIEQIEQQFIIDNLPQQQFSSPQDINNNENNNDLANLNFFDNNLNNFFDSTQSNFFDCINNLNNDNIIANDTNIEMNSELLTEGSDGLGITFPNSEFENFLSL